MKGTDIALRCNLVTLSEEETEYEKKTMIDHSSDEISTEDAAILLNAVRERLENETFRFYVGTSYRHCLIWNEGQVVELSQPHDILEQCILQYLPQQPELLEMMKISYEVLADHPINVERKKKGLRPANSCWFWGAGTKPALCSFEEKTGKKGAMVSAVDLLKGIAVGADMKVIQVEGANGGLHTNYEGKAQAALSVLLKEDYDFVYVHLEAPDEMGHQGSVERKVQAIEYLDERIVAPILKGLEESGEDFRMLVLPDHPTPICIRTHSADPVPYILYDSREQKSHTWKYNEKDASQTGVCVPEGCLLMEQFLAG
jgi:2,3-bisphosphoglycerate-independent phosphoglycerate mutase